MSTIQVEQIISSCPQIADVTVYGVEVPHCDGRAGMAAMCFREGVDVRSFDWAGMVKALEANLPAYSRPLFIRIREKLETTVTYKHIKTNLIKEGFDLSSVGSDPTFFYMARERRYVPLTNEIYDHIQRGVIQL